MLNETPNWVTQDPEKSIYFIMLVLSIKEYALLFHSASHERSISKFNILQIFSN